MKQAAQVTFEIVTPCLLGGADQETAELRAPSIRGALRHWFRLLREEKMGAEELRDAEWSIFGGIGHSQDDVRASALSVRVLPEGRLNTRPMATKELSGTGSPFDYLAWPFNREKGNARGAIQPGQRAILRLGRRPYEGAGEMPWDAMKAFLLLGALGTRSRRGYGSIWPLETTIAGEPWNIPLDLAALKSELSELLARAAVRVFALRPQADWRRAVQQCLLFLRAFRCGKQFGDAAPSKWGLHDHNLPFGEGDGLIFRPAVALPYSQRYSRNRENNFSIQYRGAKRWASPCMFKVAHLANKFVPLVVLSLRRVIPENASLDVQGRSVRHHVYGLSHDLWKAICQPDPGVWKEEVEVLVEGPE